MNEKPWAVACQIQKCSTWQQLRQLWLRMENDHQQYNKQYSDQSHAFLCQIWEKYWGRLWNNQELPGSAIGF